MSAPTATRVRRAGMQDLDALAALFDAYRQFYAQPPDLARARAFLGERMVRDESVLLLAEHADAAAGFVQLYPLFSSVRTGRRASEASHHARRAQSQAAIGGSSV